MQMDQTKYGHLMDLTNWLGGVFQSMVVWMFILDICFGYVLGSQIAIHGSLWHIISMQLMNKQILMQMAKVLSFNLMTFKNFN